MPIAESLTLLSSRLEADVSVSVRLSDASLLAFCAVLFTGRKMSYLAQKCNDRARRAKWSCGLYGDRLPIS
jgi:hypothetical protein